MRSQIPVGLVVAALVVAVCPLARAENEKESRSDRSADTLPAGAVARLGTVRFHHAAVVERVGFSPDEKMLAAADRAGAIRLWELPSGKELGVLRQHGPRINTVVFSPDGKTLATGGDEDAIRLWAVATGKEYRKIPLSCGDVQALAFSPDGKSLASGVRDPDDIGAYGRVPQARAEPVQLLQVWDVETGRLVRGLVGHKNAIWSIAFVKDGKTLASAGCDETVRLWDVETGRELRQLSTAKKAENWGFSIVLGAEKPIRIRQILFLEDGKTLAFVDERVIHFWDLETGKEARESLRMGDETDCLALSDTGKTFVTTRRGKIRAAETDSYKEVWQVSPPGPSLHSIALSPSGKMLVALVGQSIHLHDLATGKLLSQAVGHERGIDYVAFASDDKALFSIGELDDGARRWSRTGEELEKLGQRAVVTGSDAFTYSASRRFLASAGINENYRLCELDTGTEYAQIDVKGSWYLSPHVAFSPDGKLLAIAGDPDWNVMNRARYRREFYTYTLQVFDAATGKRLRSLENHNDVTSLAFSPDGKMLAVKATGSSAPPLRLWDLANGKSIPRFGAVVEGRRIAFSSDGQYLLTAGACWQEIDAAKDGPPVGRTIHFWEMLTGKEAARLEGHTGTVNCLAFAPGGTLLASGGDDDEVRLWDPRTGKPLGRLRGHRGSVTALAFSVDGKVLASGSSDTTILLWDVGNLARETQPGQTTLTSKDLDVLWEDLINGQATTAYQAAATLISNPEPSIPFLKERLRPVGEVTPEQIARLVADLDCDDFDLRRKARDELWLLGPTAEPSLRKALNRDPSPDLRQRIEQLLDRVSGPGLTFEQLRADRALSILQQIDTPEARVTLKALAESRPRGWLASRAQASIDRLNRQSNVP